jgi:hypothetical protein
MAGSLGSIYVDLGLNSGKFTDGLTGAQSNLASFGKAANTNLARTAGSFGQLNKSVGLSRTEILELGHSARATFDILAAGGSPLRALEMEGAQVVQALSMGRGGLGGAIGAIGGAIAGLATPVNLAIAAVAALGVGAVLWLTHEKSATVDATAALEAHKKWLDQILEGYDATKKAADAYLEAANKLPEGAVSSDLNAKSGPAMANLNTALAQLKKYRDELTLDLTQGVQQFGSQGAADSVAHLVDVVKKAGLSASSTKGQYDALVTSLTEIKNGADQFGPTEAFLAGKMLDLVTNAEKAATAVDSIRVAANNLPHSVTMQIKVEMQNFDGARKKLLSLVPDTRDQWTRARDDAKVAYNQALGTAPDAIMRTAVTGDYEKTLAGIDAAEKAAAAKKSGSAAESSAARQAKQIDLVTTSLKQQLAALTDSDREQAISNALTKAHVTAASADGQKIAALAGAMYDAKQHQAALNDSEHLFADTFEAGLEGVLNGTESLNNALGDLLSTMGDAILKAALLGEGPLAGLLGTAPSQAGGIGGHMGSVFGFGGAR